MAKHAFSFFGVHLLDMFGEGVSAGTWFHDQIVLWEKGGRLYRFYMDDSGSTSEPKQTDLLVDHGVATDQGMHLFVHLELNWARDEDRLLQKLEDDGKPYGTTRNLLLACGITQAERAQSGLLGLDLTRIVRHDHPNIRLLADPDGVCPEKTEYWAAWGMPNGHLMVGPWSRMMDELDSLRRSNWHTLSKHQREKLVTTLVEWRPDDIPREYRVAGLKAFHDGFAGLDESNARSNSRSWAEDNFGLADDPMALPWV